MEDRYMEDYCPLVMNVMGHWGFADLETVR